MRVYMSHLLEKVQSDVVSSKDWTWEPEGGAVHDVYASGANTSSNQSTYAAEKDDRSDSDRPDEGMLVA
jgi:hypothetical protein